MGEVVDGSPRRDPGDVADDVHRAVVGVDVDGEMGDLVVVGDVEGAVRGHPAPMARTSATVCASPSALMSVRYSSAPSRASRSAVARPIPLAAPVRKALLPAKLYAMGATIPAVTTASRRPARPRVPAATASPAPARRLDIAVGPDERGLTGQRERRRGRQRAHQPAHVGGDGVGGALGDLGLHDGHDVVDDDVVVAVEDVADLGVAVAGIGARRHDRVVMGVHGGGAAHHPLGELGRRLVVAARAKSWVSSSSSWVTLTQNVRQHGVFGVEVEVEAGARHPARSLIVLTDSSANGFSSSSSRTAATMAWRCLSRDAAAPGGFLLCGHRITLHHATPEMKLDTRQVA